jgi:hypothetical protein
MQGLYIYMAVGTLDKLLVEVSEGRRSRGSSKKLLNFW